MIEMSLEITSASKCQTCYDKARGEFWEKPILYDITVKDGLIVCAHCGAPVTSDLEVM